MFEICCNVNVVLQSKMTKGFLNSILQDNMTLPSGPLLLSPFSVLKALHKLVSVCVCIVYMCLCMCMFVGVCVRVSVRVGEHVCTGLCVHICTCICAYTCVDLCAY